MFISVNGFYWELFFVLIIKDILLLGVFGGSW